MLRHDRTSVAVLTLGLILGLGVLGLELAVHSVHHLSDQVAAAHCDVATASTHVFAACGGSAAVECPRVSIGGTQAHAHMAQVEVPPLRANQGRAPPVTRF